MRLQDLFVQREILEAIQVFKFKLEVFYVNTLFS